MDIRVLVALAIIVMVALLFLARKYSDMRVERSALEAGYFESIIAFKQDPSNPTLRKHAEQWGHKLGQSLGKETAEIEQMLICDLT